MDMILQRLNCGDEGCFSELHDDLGNKLMVSVSHSYPDGSGGWIPKVPAGTYVCRLGEHQLKLASGELSDPFSTYEITDVPGHTGILFHTGNTEYDTEGCECLGNEFGQLVEGGALLDAVLESRVAFGRFMALQDGVGAFLLTVE